MPILFLVLVALAAAMGLRFSLLAAEKPVSRPNSPQAIDDTSATFDRLAPLTTSRVVGQRLDLLTAKVLRIDVDRPAQDKPYSIPPDNPFVNVEGAAPETWAYGLRNPWRITVDSKTGRIWVGNNGQDLWEQTYLIERGANYGWIVYEGSHPFYAQRKLGPTPVSPPTTEHPHSEARSLTGGIVYRGDKFPELRGAYIYGDYSTGRIWAVKHDGRRVTEHREIADTPLQITAIARGRRGEILMLDHSAAGGIYRLAASKTSKPAAPFPRRLSESGLFASVPGHVMQPGMIPYSVNASFWSDGAFKRQYISVCPPTPRASLAGWVLPSTAAGAFPMVPCWSSRSALMSNRKWSHRPICYRSWSTLIMILRISMRAPARICTPTTRPAMWKGAAATRGSICGRSSPGRRCGRSPSGRCMAPLEWKLVAWPTRD